MVPLADMCQKRMADMPNGAHMEIGTYGDLATLHWVQNEPWGPGVLDCRVTYGACPATAHAAMFVHNSVHLCSPVHCTTYRS